MLWYFKGSKITWSTSCSHRAPHHLILNQPFCHTNSFMNSFILFTVFCGGINWITRLIVANCCILMLLMFLLIVLLCTSYLFLSLFHLYCLICVGYTHGIMSLSLACILLCTCIPCHLAKLLYKKKISYATISLM